MKSVFKSFLKDREVQEGKKSFFAKKFSSLPAFFIFYLLFKSLSRSMALLKLLKREIVAATSIAAVISSSVTPRWIAAVRWASRQ